MSTYKQIKSRGSFDAGIWKVGQDCLFWLLKFIIFAMILGMIYYLYDAYFTKNDLNQTFQLCLISSINKNYRPIFLGHFKVKGEGQF